MLCYREVIYSSAYWLKKLLNKMRLPKIRDKALLSGEIGSLLSGELAFKIYHRVTSPNWTIDSEFVGPSAGFLSFSQDNLDQLVADSALLIIAWLLASAYQSGSNTIGVLPLSNQAVFDQSLSLAINTANVIFLTLVLLCVTIGPSRIGMMVPYYELQTFISLSAVLIFRIYYARIRMRL